jgi:hypothetical protein
MMSAEGSWKKIAAAALGVTASALLLPAGCDALRTVRPTPLGDKTYQVTCPRSLAQCLTSLDPVCPDGYTVVRADENRERRGAAPWIVETVSSEAVVRCQEKASVFGSAPPDASVTPGLVPPRPPAPGCIPGASQACVGRGGCAGGQICTADGHAFGPCDCGTVGDGGASDGPRD